MAHDVRVVYVTAPPDRAPELARALVERRLCACVNVLPQVRSFFRWEGAVAEEEESMLVIKTTASGLEALRAAVVELHPYELPEVIALPVVDGHPAYLDWVREEVELP